MARTRNNPNPVETPTQTGVQAAAYPLRGMPTDQNLGRSIVEAMMNGDSSAAAKQAWNYYRTVPELHFLVTYVANAMSMVRLYIGTSDAADPDNPVEVGPRHPARDLMRNFAGGNQGQGELLARLATHLTVVGDSIIIGPNPSAGVLPHPYDTWRVYSSSEVTARSGRVYLRDPNMREQQIPDSTLPVRIWKSSPEYWWRSDSPVYAAFGVLNEIQLLSDHINATSLSRLKGAGLTFIPEEFTLPGDENDVEGESGDPFARMLSTVMGLAIKNPGSAAALVPIILRGPAEFGAAIKHFDFSTAFDAKVDLLRTEAIRRLALSMDTPPEILLGTAGSSGWSMWQVSEATERMHIRPLAHLICASLTEGWLKPALRMLPLPDQTKESIDDLVVWPDFTQLRIKIDPSADVTALYNNYEINGDVMRHHLGFGDDDKPSNDDIELQILLGIVKAGHFQLIPWAIKALNKSFGFDFPPVDELATTKGLQTGAVPAEETTPAAAAEVKKGLNPETAPVPGTNKPANPPASLTKASTPVPSTKLPGDRSQAKQSTPPTPGDIKGENNNQAKGPSK